jgi:Uma2 family endonuclease
MSAAPKLKLTPDQYLAQERVAPFKSEYFCGEVFSMAGATWEHTLIKDNLARELGNRLKDGPCRVLSSDLRVKVEKAGMYAYPDVIVVCEEPKFENDTFDNLLNPKVVVEVLSDSTGKWDRGGKFRSYQHLPTFVEYFLVSQALPLVERFVRQPDDSWSPSSFAGLDAVMLCQSLSLRIPLPDVYANVKFPPFAAENDSGFKQDGI